MVHSLSFEGTVGNSPCMVDTTKCLILSLGIELKDSISNSKIKKKIKKKPLLPSYDQEFEI